MATKGSEKVKNVVLVGQGGVGKTMLAEAMLHLTGRTTRLGGHAGTKPTLDYDGEEGLLHLHRHRARHLGGYAPERARRPVLPRLCR